MFKRKKKEEIKENIFEVSEKEFKELQEQNNKLLGWFNQEMLLKSEGVLFRGSENKDIFFVLRDLFKRVMIGLFEYEGLPEEIPYYIIEDFLFEGKCAFFEIGGKYYVSKYADQSIERDAYNNPTIIQPIFKNGRTLSNKIVDEEIVIIRNNATDLPTYNILKPFLNYLTINREANQSLMKLSMTSKVYLSDNKNTLQNIKRSIQKMLDEAGRIAVIEKGQLDKTEEFDFYEKYDNVYWDDFQNTYNFMYEILGIKTNNEHDKKERLIVDEININEYKVGAILDSLFKERNEAIKKINNLFGLNIKLKMYITYEGKEQEGKEGNEEYNEENID